MNETALVKPGPTSIVSNTPRPGSRYTFEELGRIVKSLAASGYYKNVSDVNKALTLVLIGEEMGIPPVTAIMGIHVVEGKPTLSANLLAAQIKRSGRYNFRVREHTADVCRIEFYERWNGIAWEPAGVSEFTMKEAAQAGLSGKSVWKSYPKAMLYARALSQGARWYAPDILGGAPPYYTGETSGDDGSISAIMGDGEYPQAAPDPKETAPSAETTPSSAPVESAKASEAFGWKPVRYPSEREMGEERTPGQVGMGHGKAKDRGIEDDMYNAVRETLLDAFGLSYTKSKGLATLWIDFLMTATDEQIAAAVAATHERLGQGALAV